MNQRMRNQARGKSAAQRERFMETSSFHSHTTRLQAGEPAYVVQKQKERVFSLALHGVALLSFLLLSRWCLGAIAQAVSGPLQGFSHIVELFAAILITFLGFYAALRLVQAVIRAIFKSHEKIEWPRKDVDWGKQAVVLNADGIAIANRLARRTYVWDSMAEFTESDVFVVTRKQGRKIVIPKHSENDDELRSQLMHGLSLSSPLRRRDP